MNLIQRITRKLRRGPTMAQGKKISFNASHEDLCDIATIIKNVRSVINQTDAIRYALEFTAKRVQEPNNEVSPQKPNHAHKRNQE